MQNFENYQDVKYGEHFTPQNDARLSPVSNHSSSFFMSSQSTYSPEPQKVKSYMNEINTKTMPSHTLSQENIHYQSLNSQNSLETKNQPISSNSQQEEQQVVCEDEITLLKQHLKQKYKNYSEQEIEEIIYKFINEYLIKMKNISNNDDSLEQQNLVQDINQDDGRSSLSSHLDWNDRNQLEKYCSKQKKIENEMGFRPSQYFGAIAVEELEDGIGDPKIDQLFTECFGIKPKPKKKTKQIVQNPKQYCAKPSQKENNLPLQTQIHGNNNTICLIQANFEIKNYQYSGQEGINHSQELKGIPNFYQLNNNSIQKCSAQNNEVVIPQEDDTAQVLVDKYNTMMQTQKNCQVLHQESQKQTNQKQNQNQQDSLKKYMSPNEIQKVKYYTKNSSKSIVDQENAFENGFYKTADPRQQMTLKSSSTQMSSPQSISSSHQFSKHLQQLSTLIGSNSHSSQQKEPLKNTTLSHHLSLSNLNGAKGVKHQSNHSMNKQQFKSILYKNQQAPHHSKMLSISSMNSLISADSKTKQSSKLSYMGQKQSEETLKAQNAPNVGYNHGHNSSETSLKIAPKPPCQNTQPLSAKTNRDSGNQIGSQQKCSPENQDYECSPIHSQRTLLQMHNESKPGSINSFNHTGPMNLKKQFSNFTLPAQYGNILSQSIENLQKQQDQPTSGANTQRNKLPSGKALGRNNSQNFFKTTAMLNNIQSILPQNTILEQQKNHLNSTNALYYEGQMQLSPRSQFSNKLDQESTQTFNSSQRPQTAISSNYSVITGMNQYLCNANSLLYQNKPPSKIQKQAINTLSQTQSVKNLKLQSKNLTINTIQEVQNTSRNVKNQNQNTDKPQTSRNQQHKISLKPSSLSRERNQNAQQKSLDRQKNNEYENFEKKKIMYKNQKQSFNQQVKNQSLNVSNSHKQLGKSSITRTHTNLVSPQHATAVFNDYLKNSNKVNDNNKQEPSFNKTVQRINKSLDKIKQLFMTNNGKQVPTQPQSTKNTFSKNSQNDIKSSDLIQQINCYKSFKKTNPQMLDSKAKTSTQVFQSKNSKDMNVNFDNNHSKKSAENFKKYLSGGVTAINNGTNSFK